MFLHQAAAQELIDIGVHAARRQHDGDAGRRAGRKAQADTDGDGDLLRRVAAAA